ncbi:ATP-binding protein [Accumulibacter sp.]|uniref:ATP-binding protein n=1 Tax=Accumulibacter sp. TaxID=2053492 RepID=UPI0025E03327|nr:ATP-binding protein [Accumulibacter sp.]MCM8610811.1 ATP-binding protein [Accumulibacter sp.]MCM8636496.1 ATP-binding protein [Accumulibacter sp.]MCM8640270.1 ATP-binding protein [Accumulibacter sp.]
MSTMPYQPPRHVLEVLQRIEYEAPLTADDPRYVDTREARGSQRTLDRLARKFGLLLSTGDFLPPTKKHVLFFGHTGSGKTTELRRYARDLNGAQRFLVVEVDIGATLDHNNLQYADTLMAMARSLLGALDAAGVHPRSSALAELENWFNERVLSSEEGREFRAEVETGVQAKTGLPFLAELFARFTAAFRTNVAYKDSLRRVIRNSFSQFAEAFNTLLRDGEEALVAAGKGRRVLFMIDGTDKLRSEDRLRFFVHDAEQLLAIDAHVVYTAPLSLKYEGNLTNRLDADLVLPMIKLGERDGSRCAAGARAVKDILLKRADRSLFASEREIERLVEHCGGHPRELLKLLKLCCEFAEEDSIDARTVEQAIAQLASEYRRFLEPDDYRLLAQLDRDAIHAGNDERTRRLLYHLALLEYNDGAWRRSHPVVRTLEGYRLAAAEQPPQRGAL